MCAYYYLFIMATCRPLLGLHCLSMWSLCCQFQIPNSQICYKLSPQELAVNNSKLKARLAIFAFQSLCTIQDD